MDTVHCLLFTNPNTYIDTLPGKALAWTTWGPSSCPQLSIYYYCSNPFNLYPLKQRIITYCNIAPVGRNWVFKNVFIFLSLCRIRRSWTQPFSQAGASQCPSNLLLWRRMGRWGRWMTQSPAARRTWTLLRCVFKGHIHAPIQIKTIWDLKAHYYSFTSVLLFWNQVF